MGEKMTSSEFIPKRMTATTTKIERVKVLQNKGGNQVMKAMENKESSNKKSWPFG